ncbi:methyltransferase-like protein 7B [Ixodes scapularis]|uniref:methyltransferase-like protein 7B n=1 Tax=Ixodes scapularis TaxID=6945 RepID=UPI001A9D17C0|nr:methyltransferase-like protein 7B [Ixodes scapularis]XP_040072916.1 methyltransferase-like protein 7B [Ixodes scapularis]
MARLDDILMFCFCYGTMALGVFLLVPFKMSKKLHEAFFARIVFPLVMHIWGDRFTAVRRQAMSQLNDLVSHDGTLKKEGAIRVLEIGAGFGANLEHVQRNVKYWNVDPNAEFDDGFRKNLKKNPNVEMERWIHEYAEDMQGVPEGHFDVVLITYVLCSVTEVRKVLAECRRVLAKGGRLVFLEHVAHPAGTWGSVVQTLLDPMWSFSFCGCHINRRPEQLLMSAGFDEIKLTEVFLNMPTVLSPNVYGSAVVVKN